MSDEKKCICLEDETIELPEGAECVRAYLETAVNAAVKGALEVALKYGCGCQCVDEGNGNCPGTGDGDGDGPGTGDGDGDGDGDGPGTGDGDGDGDGDGPGTGDGDGDGDGDGPGTGDGDGECELIDVESESDFEIIWSSLYSSSYRAEYVFRKAMSASATDCWASGVAPTTTPQHIGVTFGDRSFIIKKVEVENRAKGGMAPREFTIMYMDKDGEWHDMLPEHLVNTSNASRDVYDVVIPMENRFPVYGIRVEVFSTHYTPGYPSTVNVAIGRIRLCGTEVH